LGGDRKVHKVLVGKPEGKIPLGRPRRRWKDGMKMDVREIGWRCVDWVRLALDKDGWRVMNTVMNFRFLATDSKTGVPVIVALFHNTEIW
jgi:hypothetical protein